MKSPITGKEMILTKEKRKLSFRKEEIIITHHSYLCEKTGEQFETDEITDLNLTQVYNQYREKHNLPFPEEIKEIRQKYGLSAAKMSEILGFGINTYRSYEAGEIPNTSSARLIQSAGDPEEFQNMLIRSNVFSEKEQETFLKKINIIIDTDNKANFVENLLKSHAPSALNGYRRLNIDKSFNLVLYLAENLQPWKTQLNKLLFYCDFHNYRKYGHSITGLCYIAIPRGPVPDRYEYLFSIAEDFGFIERTLIDISRDKEGEKISPKSGKEFDESKFLPEEFSTIKEVISHYGHLNTTKIIEHSHKEKGWIDNEATHRPICYDYGFELLPPPPI
ncbi:MAG: type II TA system antitoxin MqsA family protein [Bacteroidota bacterium]